jgi:aryl-alcohol dehydrogenase-like predicted oxidoreductase
MAIQTRFGNLDSLRHIGLGCLQLETLKDKEAVDLIIEAYRSGVRVFDTAAAYGSDRHNEKLLGQAIKKITHLFGESASIFFSTKCGINFATLNTKTEGYEGNPEQIYSSVDLSLKALDVEQIPLLYLHRINPKASEQELLATFNALKGLAEQKKIRYIGLSEPTSQQIQLADEVFKKTTLSYNPLAFVQSACSVATQRAFRNGVYQICREKGIQFVSYTSTIMGLVDERLSSALTLSEIPQMEITDIIKNIQASLGIPKEDFRFFVGFFHESVIKANIQSILRFQKLAKELNILPSQLALAWQKANKLLPIPGTTNLQHLHSNVAAMSIDLTLDQIEQINACFENFKGSPHPSLLKKLDNEALETDSTTKKSNFLKPKQGIKFALGSAFALAVAYVAGAIFKSRTAAK